MPYADEIVRLSEQLRELDLIDPENVGRLKYTEGAWAIEADHLDGGPWLYSRDGLDTIVATRLRSDDRYEHAVLDDVRDADRMAHGVEAGPQTE